MSVRAAASFAIVRYDPGNPEFPTLPDGVIVPHVLPVGTGGGDLRARKGVDVPLQVRVMASAPADDEQRFAGWQTETTWVNPSIIDFGVIPSPVQRTVSLYNARTTPVEVTALSLPTGVSLISPALPVTLQPYGGDTFLLEASTTGDNEFDEFHVFTTSEGDVTVRLLGRRVFTINIIPQAPMRETLRFRTDLIRSTDGTEKAYGLLQSPSVTVDYHVKFTDDIQRIRFKNQFIAGESALVVAGQKWYEARSLLNPATALDTTLDVDTNVINASWKIGGPVSVVTEEGVATAGQLDSHRFQPDEYFESNVAVLRFDGADGSQSTSDISAYAHEITWLPSGNAEVSTDQYKWGGSSYFGGTSFPVFTHTGAEMEYGPEMEFADDDWTIDFWMRPTAADVAGSTCPLARWNTLVGGRQWRILVNTGSIQFATASPSQTVTFSFGSPVPIQADTWHYIRIVRNDTSLFCFVDGVQIGSPGAIAGSILTSGLGSPDLKMQIGNYYDSGFVAPFRGYLDDIRVTVGTARSIADFTPPTEQAPVLADTYLELTLSSEFDAEAPAGSKVMPVGLGYVSSFPKYKTHAKNLEEAKYSLVFNREQDESSLDPSFPTLTDLQSPQNTLPVLDFCNEITSGGKASSLTREEFSLDSGLSNRIAFTKYPFGENVSEFRITLYSAEEMWKWKTFIHYLRGSYGEFFVPTFTNDLPGVTTTASNVFSCEDTDLALLFGNPPDARRNAIRLIFPDGTVQYRMITAVIDNVATEQITVDSPVNAGNPEIGYLQRCRILGDTATFVHTREGDVELRFRFRTVLL